MARAKQSEWRFDFGNLGLEALRLLGPETARHAAFLMLKAGLVPQPTPIDDRRLAIEVFNRRLLHPIGIAVAVSYLYNDIQYINSFRRMLGITNALIDLKESD
jgi:hypothetical protein